MYLLKESVAKYIGLSTSKITSISVLCCVVLLYRCVVVVVVLLYRCCVVLFCCCIVVVLCCFCCVVLFYIGRAFSLSRITSNGIYQSPSDFFHRATAPRVPGLPRYRGFKVTHTHSQETDI